MFAGVPEWFLVVAFGLFGLLFGSFANVMIWRVPRGESIASPGSHCPGCNAPIAWYDNVPLASWLVLRGRCRSCGTAIALRYPLVEAASGALFVVAALVFGPTLRGAAAATLFWFLLVLSLIDLDTMRLPNVIVGTLAILGGLGVVVSEVAGRRIIPLLDVASPGLLAQPLASAAMGALLGAGLAGGVAALFAVIRGKTGLGMGDVKLLGVLGLFLGPYVLLSLFIASICGAVFGIAAARGGKLSEARIPFGPWLALGGAITALVGPAIVRWYLGVAGLS